MSATEVRPDGRRMTGEERREQILEAARGVFADGGYDGTTTDQVARAAGVSQPYVIRLFGSKQELFLQLYRQAAARVTDVLAAVPPGPDAGRAMGEAYAGLLTDRDELRLLMHGFMAGTDPQIGAIARHTLAEAFRLFGERTGAPDEVARDFVAQGMLINVLLATDAPRHAGEDRALDVLIACTLGGRLPLSTQVRS